MPGNFLSADTGFPQLSEGMSGDEKLSAVLNYLYMLLEQLRYTLANLGKDNFNETSLMELQELIVTGCIKVTDMEDESKTTVINGASITTARLNAAEIDASTMTGSEIYASRLFGSEFYAAEDGGYSRMDSTGLDLYTPDGLKKIGLGYAGADRTDYPYLVLGAGTGQAWNGSGVVQKLGNGLWIGDDSVAADGGAYPGGAGSVEDISADFPYATGIFVDFLADRVYRYAAGVPAEI